MNKGLSRLALAVILALALIWPAPRLTVFAKKTLRVMTYNIHVFYRTGDRVRAKKAWVVTTLASDHVPVVAELEIQ